MREPTFGEQFESGGGGANILDPVTSTSYTITALSGGSDTVFSWSKVQMSMNGSTVQMDTLACGGTSPSI